MYSLLDNNRRASLGPAADGTNNNGESSGSKVKRYVAVGIVLLIAVLWFSSSGSAKGTRSSSPSSVTLNNKGQSENEALGDFLEDEDGDDSYRATSKAKDEWEPSQDEDVYADEFGDEEDEDEEQDKLPKDYVDVEEFDVDEDDYLSKSDNDTPSPEEKKAEESIAIEESKSQVKPEEPQAEEKDQVKEEPSTASSTEEKETATESTQTEQSEKATSIDEEKIEKEGATDEKQDGESEVDVQETKKLEFDNDEDVEEETKTTIPKPSVDLPTWKITGEGDCPSVTDNSKRVLHFIEIPKTNVGGVTQTLNAWAKKSNPPAKIYRTEDNTVKVCPNQSLLDVNILIGRGYGYCTEVQAKKNLLSMAILRGPIARVGYLFDTAPEKFKEERSKFGTLRTAFGDMVKEYNRTTGIVEPGEKLVRGFGSSQARYLCGFECVGLQATIQDEATILERAKANLVKLDIVGLTEELSTLAWQVKYFLPSLTPKMFKTFPKEKEQATKKSLIDDETKAILQQWAWVDKALYLEAKQLYEKRTELAKRCLEDIAP
jgi:hypothetical protein